MFPVSLCGGVGGGSETEYGRNNRKTKEKKKGRKEGKIGKERKIKRTKEIKENCVVMPSLEF